MYRYGEADIPDIRRHIISDSHPFFLGTVNTPNYQHPEPSTKNPISSLKHSIFPSIFSLKFSYKEK
jgi:hypothetical protein